VEVEVEQGMLREGGIEGVLTVCARYRLMVCCGRELRESGEGTEAGQRQGRGRARQGPAGPGRAR
jgi:hypothetical protein